MARIRISRNSFSGGVISKAAQANTVSQFYNYSLDVCRNMVINPLGGAYKRQGTVYVSDLASEEVKLVEYFYESGKSCIIVFSEGTTASIYGWFRNYQKPFQSEIRKFEIELGEQLKYEDFKRLQYFSLENKLYFYINRREGGPTAGFWTFELVSGTEFEFELHKGIEFAPGPKSPLFPARLLYVVKISESDTNFTLTLKTERGEVDGNIFNEKLIGCKISYKLIITPLEDNKNAEVYYPELEIKEVQDGIITLAELTPASTKMFVSQNEVTVREWFISAFDGNETYGGILNNPDAMCLLQGRLIIGKKSLVFASKVDINPLCFAMGADPEDGFTYSIVTGNMGDILWVSPIEKLMIGSSNGVYLIGNSARFAEPLTHDTFVPTKIGVTGSNSLPAVTSEGNILFVGSDSRSVYEVSITQYGEYMVMPTNELSLDMVREGIIDHTWQQNPRKVYWGITRDGALVGSSYRAATESEPAIRAWHDHVLGGESSQILQCETSMADGFDLLWVACKRDVGGEGKITLEYLPKPFSPLDDEIFEQQYSDCSVTVMNAHIISNIENAGNCVVNQQYEEEDFDVLIQYVTQERGRLILVHHTDAGLDRVYINDQLNYFSLTKNYFGIDAYDSRYIPAIGSFGFVGECYCFFETNVLINSITNIDGQLHNMVLVHADTTLFRRFHDNGMVLFSDTGNNGLDNNVFGIGDFTPDGFILLDYVTRNPITLVVQDISDKSKIFFATNNALTLSAGKDPKVIFDANLFDETLINATLHTCKLRKVYGATGYNTGDFNLKLDEINLEDKIFKYGCYRKPNEGEDETITYVANTSRYGIYSTTIVPNGYAYFYFDKVRREEISHLIGQAIWYCSDGNWTYRKIFTLSEDLFDEENLFKLNTPVVAANFGLPYSCSIMPVPAEGGSIFGTSDGLMGRQRPIMISLYSSIGGEYAPYINEKLYPIDYPINLSALEERPLYTGSITLPISSAKDSTIRTVYLYQMEPVSFNVLGIVQDIIVQEDVQ
jgi:hypothetical protein